MLTANINTTIKMTTEVVIRDQFIVGLKKGMKAPDNAINSIEPRLSQ